MIGRDNWLIETGEICVLTVLQPEGQHQDAGRTVFCAASPLACRPIVSLGLISSFFCVHRVRTSPSF